MILEDFRRLALGLPEAVEGAHMGHPDFRVGGKIFATLCVPSDEWGMVKLTPEQQAAFVEAHPKVFTPVKGGWGLRGATNVRLQTASTRTLQPALATAWRNTAPAALVRAASQPEPRRAARKPAAATRPASRPAAARRRSRKG